MILMKVKTMRGPVTSDSSLLDVLLNHAIIATYWNIKHKIIIILKTDILTKYVYYYYYYYKHY